MLKVPGVFESLTDLRGQTYRQCQRQDIIPISKEWLDSVHTPTTVASDELSLKGRNKPISLLPGFYSPARLGRLFDVVNKLGATMEAPLFPNNANAPASLLTKVYDVAVGTKHAGTPLSEYCTPAAGSAATLDGSAVAGSAIKGETQQIKELEYPGPMCCPLTRAEATMLANHRDDYLVCEKSDGLRAMLVYRHEPTFPTWYVKGTRLVLLDTLYFEQQLAKVCDMKTSVAMGQLSPGLLQFVTGQQQQQQGNSSGGCGTSPLPASARLMYDAEVVDRVVSYAKRYEEFQLRGETSGEQSVENTVGVREASSTVHPVLVTKHVLRVGEAAVECVRVVGANNSTAGGQQQKQPYNPGRSFTYFVDRRMTCAFMLLHDELQLGEGTATLEAALDGELIVDIRTHQLLYTAFDVLYEVTASGGATAAAAVDLGSTDDPSISHDQQTTDSSTNTAGQKQPTGRRFKSGPCIGGEYVCYASSSAVDRYAALGSLVRRTRMPDMAAGPTDPLTLPTPGQWRSATRAACRCITVVRKDMIPATKLLSLLKRVARIPAVGAQQRTAAVVGEGGAASKQQPPGNPQPQPAEGPCRWVYDGINYNDGLIFTPVDQPFVPGAAQRQLKWKWLETLTVDFLVKIGGRSVDPSTRWGQQQPQQQQQQQQRAREGRGRGRGRGGRGGSGVVGSRGRGGANSVPEDHDQQQDQGEDAWKGYHMYVLFKRKNFKQAGGEVRQLVEHTTGLLHPTSLDQLRAVVSGSPEGSIFRKHGMICECAFDGKYWRVVKERHDKLDPNAFITAASVFEAIADAFDLPDLCEAVAGMEGGDDAGGMTQRGQRSYRRELPMLYPSAQSDIGARAQCEVPPHRGGGEVGSAATCTSITAGATSSMGVEQALRAVTDAATNGGPDPSSPSPVQLPEMHMILRLMKEARRWALKLQFQVKVEGIKNPVLCNFMSVARCFGLGEPSPADVPSSRLEGLLVLELANSGGCAQFSETTVQVEYDIRRGRWGIIRLSKERGAAIPDNMYKHLTVAMTARLGMQQSPSLNGNPSEQQQQPQQGGAEGGGTTNSCGGDVAANCIAYDKRLFIRRNSLSGQYDRLAPTDPHYARQTDAHKDGGKRSAVRLHNNVMKRMLYAKAIEMTKATTTTTGPNPQQAANNNKNKSGNIAAMELCCGRGGDLHKWKASNRDMSFLMMVDSCFEAVVEAASRYSYEEGLSCAVRSDVGCIPANFHVADCFNHNRLKWVIPPIMASHNVSHFDIVSCQFSMHYAFAAEASVRGFLSNVSTWLNPHGGLFIGTLVDDTELRRRSNDGTLQTFGNDVYRVSGLQPGAGSAEHEPYGRKYKIQIEDVIEEDEYVVDWENFTRLAEADFGLRCIYQSNFAQQRFELMRLAREGAALSGSEANGGGGGGGRKVMKEPSVSDGLVTAGKEAHHTKRPRSSNDGAGSVPSASNSSSGSSWSEMAAALPPAMTPDEIAFVGLYKSFIFVKQA